MKIRIVNRVVLEIEFSEGDVMSLTQYVCSNSREMKNLKCASTWKIEPELAALQQG